MACRVYGNVGGVFNGAKAGVVITIELTQKNQYSDTENDIYRILVPESKSVTSGPNGEWEVLVLDNENMKKPGVYKFTFAYGDNTYVWEKYIPNLAEAEFTSLVDFG